VPASRRDRWQVDETYVKVAGRWRYVYRAIDQFGQVIDVFVAARRDAKAARRFFEQVISTTRVGPSEVVTDQAPTYPVVLEQVLPAALHRTHRYADNHVEADHGRLKAPTRSHAWAQAGPQRPSGDRRACLRAEPSARTLRAGSRGAHQPASGGHIRRTGLGDLIQRRLAFSLP
jgi:hypothetical protein